jgi:hypothetical protein
MTGKLVELVELAELERELGWLDLARHEHRHELVVLLG